MPSYDYAATLFLGLSHLHGVGFKTLRELGGVDAVASKVIAGELDELVSTAVGGPPAGGVESALFARGEEVVETLRAYGVDLVRLGDPMYPPAFMDLLEADRPLWVFCRGDITLLRNASVAVVGTRNPSPIGEFLTKYAVAVLAEASIPVVSGLARGIDAIAHDWALRSGIPNISVLGTGILRHYPARNSDLAERIVSGGGVLVSEYPPLTEPTGETFVWRNRLQAALACCVIAPEWRRSSGTAHTMRFAHALNRPTVGLRLASVEPASNRGEAEAEFTVPAQSNQFRAAVFRAVDESLSAARHQSDLFGAARA